ncbi:hypothetical protein [Streptomyces genisteinicus]|uniref:WD40 repeat domain-containing protein n=1 Tax=Streptomyces genisteinicus TaxID=2768068 RepID=A0A7H0HZZ4_9ACTN|nr:hypothetical protein [Streptomyces genisteinicus]QNP66110.1 hypothetical protein IAG43_26410 [Streptomyces genisteinicus]
MTTGRGGGMRGTVWAAANQLGVVAGTPAELRSALLSGAATAGSRLVLPGADPAAVTELAAVMDEFGHGPVRIDTPPGGAAPGAVDPSDAVSVCSADPQRVTLAYEESEHDHGGLRTAWLRAGQALVREQEPAARALCLLAALPARAEPGVRTALDRLAEAAPWSVGEVREDVGPVVAATVFAGRMLVADRGGTVHGLDAARPVAVATGARIRAVAALPDTTVLLLDERGRLRTHGPGSALTAAVQATLAAHPGTALAVSRGAVVVGDRTGSVHAFGAAGLHQAALHCGRVTALAAADGDGPPAVLSGGADGSVRRWRPGRRASGTTVAERPCPVVALHAAATADGTAFAVAWADGLVELHRPGRGRAPLGFRPGPAVRAVALTPDDALAVGTDETLCVLRPR